LELFVSAVSLKGIANSREQGSIYACGWIKKINV
jgi:hypothetical protein